MQTKVFQVLENILPVNLPNGNYAGKWTGYIIKVTIAGKKCQLETEIGIRGIDEPCTVRVLYGDVTVSIP